MSEDLKLETLKEVQLKSRSADGELLQATFAVDKGMNLISYSKGEREVIDQSTQTLFEERFAGLGALIGPHFHRRNPGILPKIPDETRFPHIARVKAKGVSDPFSHGIGRYAPWKAEATETSLKGILSGKDQWNEVPLASLEGQPFTMRFNAELSSEGLLIDISVVSETDSLVGLHYYYHLPEGQGKVISQVQNHYMDQSGRKPIPKDWDFDQHQLTFDLQNAADFTFHPFPQPRQGEILLDAGSYRLMTKYWCASQENCWQLYHPEGASYVCIEPISSQDPRHPNLTVSSLKIQLHIL